ncbi:MAG: peptide chain release factor N(5)-glutamine methyltransferase [Thermodesulfobacteriota bacterium]
MSQPTVRDILQKSTAFLAERGVDSPALSAQLLLGKALGLSRLDLLLQSDRPLDEAELAAARELVRRRGRGEPAAYILGEKEFFGLAFAVTPATLIPRPETEHIVEEAEARFARDAELAFADLGTGGGCLAVTLAVRFPQSRGLAVDLSAEALAVARGNAARHGVGERLRFLEGDFTDLAGLGVAPASLDLVVANPPYVSEAEYAAVSPEVRDFEPRTALVPGPSGLEAIAALAPGVRAALRDGGWLLLEMGWTQAAAVRGILSGAGFAEVLVRKDLAGRDRLAAARA